MKRFYKHVAVTPADGGFRVMLDERAIRTQRGAPQVVPTRALAEALADEWREQGEEIDPARFTLRDLADFAIDEVTPDKAQAVEKLLTYAETDTLCYRADPDEPLFRRQQERWDPLLVEMEQRHGLRFERVSGIVHRPQPAETIARLRELLSDQDPFALAPLQMLASLAASLTVALAALEPDADPEALFTISNCEEDWQAEQWGWDLLAEERRTIRLEAFRAATRFLQLARED
ncbi:ATP12 family chaperone protein [Altericroceibacterium xinjiangense]|uniref:ATP12 family chaperone protein n=1 Tax=Altericroceibacterium xinjiangense TaxID=762261 RepID=UPI000F7F3B0A|nr:ATP12 family protein [Altericroceibacterium xinjiangense]